MKMIKPIQENEVIAPGKQSFLGNAQSYGLQTFPLSRLVRDFHTRVQCQSRRITKKASVQTDPLKRLEPWKP